MPCSDGGPTRYEEQREYQEKIDRLTALLCEQCRSIQESVDSGEPNPMTPAVREWWAAHKLHDALTIERENRQREASLAYKQQQIAQLQAEIERLKKS